MDGISTVAPLKLANNYKYNGKELNHKEFSDGSGLDWYSYGFREYDPQIGRFPQLDPLTDEFAALTPYQYASNDPIGNIDLDGLEGVGSVGGLASDASKGIDASLQLGEVVVRAAKPVTTSANVLQGLSAVARIGGITSIALHGLQITGEVFGEFGITKAVGSQISINEMKAIFPNANQNIAQGFVSNFNTYSGDFGITNDVTTAQFLAQAGVETWNGFTTLSEKMNYSTVAGLKSTYPRLFDTGPYNAKDYVDNGDALAKIAYGANNLGQDYRGRGVIQLTGKSKYKGFTDFYDRNFNSSVDFVAHPNLINENYKYATMSGLWFFQKYILNNNLIDVANVKQVTEVIHGSIGKSSSFAQRQAYFKRALFILFSLIFRYFNRGIK